MTKGMMNTALMLSLAFVPCRLAAQSTGLALGVDALLGLHHRDGPDGHITSVELPTGRLRVGAGLGSRLGIESTVSFSRTSSGDHTGYVLQLGPSLTFGLTDGTGVTPFVRAGAGLARSGGDLAADTQWALAGGVGVRIPVSDQAAARFELAADRAFESDHQPRTDTLGLVVGISFRVR